MISKEKLIESNSAIASIEVKIANKKTELENVKEIKKVFFDGISVYLSSMIPYSLFVFFLYILDLNSIATTETASALLFIFFSGSALFLQKANFKINKIFSYNFDDFILASCFSFLAGLGYGFVLVIMDVSLYYFFNINLVGSGATILAIFAYSALFSWLIDFSKELFLNYKTTNIEETKNEIKNEINSNLEKKKLLLKEIKDSAILFHDYNYLSILDSELNLEHLEVKSLCNEFAKENNYKSFVSMQAEKAQESLSIRMENA